MDEPGFRHAMERAGKKERVVNGLVGQVRAFEGYLDREKGIDLGAASEQDLRDYVDVLEPKAVKERMRGLALYYEFVGNSAMARLAGEIREQRIAKSRKAFKLREFRGVDPVAVARLDALGIVTVDDMLAAGKTPADRQALAQRSGVDPAVILELVKLADISRLGAIKAVRARLYYDAGLDTPDRFAAWEPDALRAMLVAWVERTGFDGIAPLPKEIRNAIAAARSMPRVVTYE